MAKNPDEISSEIRAKLAITTPGLSMELGTPERKIVDAVAESISEAYIDQYLVGSLMDIESKAGLELEQFVGIFGFGRLQGRQAEGVVRVELTNASPQDVILPVGSQFYTRNSLPGTTSTLYFTSKQATVIPTGSFVADVPVKCAEVGTAGNVPPDSIVYLGSIVGSSSVTNLTSMTGGIDVETDAELRQRFKDTFLRNIAGTEDWYLGLCYQNKNVSKAACFGPIRKYVTQIEVPGDDATLNLSSIITDDVKYAWPGEGHVSVFKNIGQEDEVFYQMYDDFLWTPGESPQFTNVASGELVGGDIVDLEFEYTTESSRNDPQAGIANKVDIFVNGTDPYTVTERTIVTDTTLSSTPADELYTGNFARVGSTGTPSATNRFMRLGSVPVMSFPSTITLGVVNYQQGTHYHLLRGTTLLAGSPFEVAGIEWAVAGPSSTTEITISYTYNRVPEVLNALVKQQKQITTDVMVHDSAYAFLRIYLSVEFERNFVASQVTSAIQQRLRDYFNGLPHGSWIEMSDLTLATHQVFGVDNVWVTESTEPGVGSSYGIKLYANSADEDPEVQHTEDFKLTDNRLPIFLDAVILRKANR